MIFKSEIFGSSCVEIYLTLSNFLKLRYNGEYARYIPSIVQVAINRSMMAPRKLVGTIRYIVQLKLEIEKVHRNSSLVSIVCLCDEYDKRRLP